MNSSNAIDVQTSRGSVSGAFVRWLTWIQHWFLWSCNVPGGGAPAFLDLYGLQHSRARRRGAVHFQRCAVPAGRDFSTFSVFLPPEQSPTQRLEALVRLSGLGRVHIYRMRYWGSVLQRRARLVCYDHGWWRAPALRLRAAPVRPP